ncbi:hypothetical protein Ciccas_001758 [Cichlidogyrus casuarinus]|uniref:Uncharacterized protein n=1 Tax=Cichlidogyrus casuarinus TaxID=1844966 RepID=A0ABD2QJ59_9PLAT
MPQAADKAPRVRMLQGLRLPMVDPYEGLLHLGPVWFRHSEDLWTEYLIDKSTPRQRTPISIVTKKVNNIPTVRIKLRDPDQEMVTTPQTPGTSRRIIVIPPSPDPYKMDEALEKDNPLPTPPLKTILKVRDGESNFVAKDDQIDARLPIFISAPVSNTHIIKSYDFTPLLRQPCELRSIPDDVVIIQADMPLEMQLRAIAAVYIPLRDHPNKSDTPLSLQPIAMALKRYMQELDGHSWHVVIVVGQFSSFISHEPDRMLQFRYRRFIVLLWKVER